MPERYGAVVRRRGRTVPWRRIRTIDDAEGVVVRAAGRVAGVVAVDETATTVVDAGDYRATTMTRVGVGAVAE